MNPDPTPRSWRVLWAFALAIALLGAPLPGFVMAVAAVDAPAADDMPCHDGERGARCPAGCCTDAACDPADCAPTLVALVPPAADALEPVHWSAPDTRDATPSPPIPDRERLRPPIG